MKTCLKSLSLLLLASAFPCVGLAEMVGARIPVAVTAENMISVFAVVSLGVILSFDYTRPGRRPAINLDPCGRSVRDESHRLAA